MTKHKNKITQLKLENVKPKKAIITDVQTEDTKVKGFTKQRLAFSLKHNGHDLKTCDAWIMDRTGEKKVTTLWVNPESTHISKKSNLGAVMDYYDVSCIEDFIDMEVLLFPDLKNYLVIAACPVDESDLNPVLNKKDLYK